MCQREQIRGESNLWGEKSGKIIYIYPKDQNTIIKSVTCKALGICPTGNTGSHS